MALVILMPLSTGCGLGDPALAVLPNFLPYPKIWLSLETPVLCTDCPSTATLSWHEVTVVIDEPFVTQSATAWTSLSAVSCTPWTKCVTVRCFDFNRD